MGFVRSSAHLVVGCSRHKELQDVHLGASKRKVLGRPDRIARRQIAHTEGAAWTHKRLSCKRRFQQQRFLATHT